MCISQSIVDHATKGASDATVFDELEEKVEVVSDCDGAVRLWSESKDENEHCLHAIVKRLQRDFS